MTALEKLARRICWLEFARKPSGTEAVYWRGVHPDKKAEYTADARWLAWMAGTIALTRGNSVVLTRAQVELRQKGR